ARVRCERRAAEERRGARRPAAAAFAAMLDNDGADIARRADRREGEKERMVALLPRHCPALADAVLALGLADAPHLRGARFAAHRHRRVGDARGIGGAALLVD